jgi:hypothetical protein
VVVVLVVVVLVVVVLVVVVLVVVVLVVVVLVVVVAVVVPGLEGVATGRLMFAAAESSPGGKTNQTSAAPRGRAARKANPISTTRGRRRDLIEPTTTTLPMRPTPTVDGRPRFQRPAHDGRRATGPRPIPGGRRRIPHR